jgi:hypothetical protein
VYKKSGEQVILRVGLAIAHPIEEVLEACLDVSRRKEWDVKFHKGRLVKQISEENNIDVSIQLGGKFL